MDQPKKNYTSKLGKAFSLYSVVILIGFLVVFSFPDFISEDERTLTECLPWKLTFILWGIFAVLIGIGQTRKSPLFEPKWFRDSILTKIFTFFLVVPSFSFLPVFMSGFAIYGLINYSFVNEAVVLEGKLYKKEISESTGRRSRRIHKDHYILSIQ